MTKSFVTLNLPEKMSREHEKMLLRDIAAAIPQGNYLTDFFRQEVVEWACSKIDNDFPPDVWDAYQFERKQHTEESARLLSQITDLKNSLSQQVELVKILRQQLATREEQVQDQQSQIQTLESSICKLRDQLEGDVEAHLAQVDGLRDDLERREQSIRNLKARLFDLEHPELA